MGLHPTYGHEALTDRFGRAIRGGRFPQTVLFTGPLGSGKQRIALWVAQALLCDQQDSPPCGACAACKQVDRLVHPDLHWFVPIAPRKRASTPEKQIEAVEDALADVMKERRDESCYHPVEDAASHPIASVRLLQRRVALKPFQGSRKVVILGDAERLVVQEASQEAANALLKVLEEPPADTTVILTAASPHRLLPTIRSRLVPMRVNRIPEEAVRKFFESEVKLTGKDLDQVVQHADGLIGRGLAHRQQVDAADKAARVFLSALKAGSAAWAGLALTQPPWGTRSDFVPLLDALSNRLRKQLRDDLNQDRRDPRRILAALGAIDRHRARCANNVNPQIGMAVLACELDHIQ